MFCLLGVEFKPGLLNPVVLFAMPMGHHVA